MSGDRGPRVAPLRPGDLRRLGRYEVLGRLGEGGMGTVYLARDPNGRQVAIKVIRAELTIDDEFRRRFRGEVNRARQVPPFCTAEVLDADPNHERPYLVVEYVEGPSLTAVVEERGPLTPANLHGLAIGVATALTAIHGAGVIHRDLKPSNVLLAPGSPKVIDFGIARAVEATSWHTRTNQMVGTVAYMAPERFGSDAGTALTPAADVFAWGAVVAYAGTGRTPFGADTPPVVATRILTGHPDLTGLVPPLRDLVERTLAKDPAQRPTSRELLDMLLAAGPHRPAVVAAALAEQPALLVAAEEAQAATDHHPVRQATAAAVPPELAEAAAGPTGSATTYLGPPALDSPVAEPTPPSFAPDAALVPSEPAPAPPAPAAVAAPAPRTGGRMGRIANLALALAVLVTSLTVAGVVTGVLPFDRSDDPAGAGPSGTPAASSPSGSARASQVVIEDPLTAPRGWRVRDDQAEKTTCRFDSGLVVTRAQQGSYRCPGPMDAHTDFTVAVDVRLRTEGACAAIWFRFDGPAGYLLRICQEGYHLATHGAGDGRTVRVLRTILFASALPLGDTVRVGVAVEGTTIALERDGDPVGTVQDTTFARGRTVLGIFSQTPDHAPPFRVTFNDLEIRAFTP
ncbi:protein kinase [Micromonospora sp. CPCC 205371]|nr:protein kinase [Micromonospora sp. CPCC 205371]